MVSCRSPFFPKIVIFTSSSKLASLSLKSVAFEASTVKIFWFPSILEKVSPFERRVTSSVKQNFDGVYRSWNVRSEEGEINQSTLRSPPHSAKSPYSRRRRCRAWYSSPSTWPHQ